MESKWANEPDAAALYESHRKLKTDPVESIREFEALADRGSLMSMVYVGHAYRRGKGVSKDLARAEAWFRRAYEGRSLEGLRHLGITWAEMGRTEEAEAIFQEGVSQDYSPVMHRLAKLYLKSTDPHRQKMAIPVLERGTKLGHVFAKRTLAGLMITGRMGLENIPRGFRLLTESVVEAFRLGRSEPFNERIQY
jgi:TPR repeat protein